MAFIMKYIREKKALTTLNKGVYCSFIGRDINVYFIGFIDWEIYVTEYTSGAIQGTVTLSFCFPCKIMPDFETGNHCERSERGGEAPSLAREIFLTSYGKSNDPARPSRSLTSYFS